MRDEGIEAFENCLGIWAFFYYTEMRGGYSRRCAEIFLCVLDL